MRRLALVLAAVLTLVVPAAAAAAVTEHPLPAGSSPLGIAQAPDGAMWAVEDGDQSIARVAPDGTVTRFPATGFTSLIDATVDLTGSLWFTGGRSDRLGRATTGATLGPIATWNFGNGCDPTGIATATDGSVWFTKRGCDVLGRLAPGSAPNSAHDDVSVPRGTRAAADRPRSRRRHVVHRLRQRAHRPHRRRRNAVLARPGRPRPALRPRDRPRREPVGHRERRRGAILRVTPAGAVTRFSDGLTDGATPQGIAASTDGNLYVAAYRANAIARVTTAGAITEIPLRAGAGPRGVAPAADGSIWFTAYDGGWIGHLTPDPPPPVPVTAGPAPQLGRTVVAAPTQGTVRVTLPGAGRSFVLRGADDIPVGSTLDTRQGRVSITSALPGNTTQRGNFWGGFFKVRQSRSSSLGGMTTLELRSNLSCSTGARTAATRRKRRSNTLWGSDRRGRFRTHGRNATATVRGTVWRTIDRCDGTLVTVQSGSVRVRDRVRGRTVTVRRGHSYLARNRYRVGLLVTLRVKRRDAGAARQGRREGDRSATFPDRGRSMAVMAPAVSRGTLREGPLAVEHRPGLRTFALAPLLGAAVGLVMLLTSVGDSLEDQSLDVRARLSSDGAPSNIAVVAIDSEDVRPRPAGTRPGRSDAAATAR